MPEVKTLIPQKEFRAGFYIELECSICMITKESVTADTKKELYDKLKEDTEQGNKWRNIDSDLFGLRGWHCGCNYKD